MKIFSNIFFVLSVALLIPAAMGSPMNASARIDLEKIKASDIFSVEILAIPTNLSTIVNITQETIRRGYFYKITIQDINITPYSKTFKEALISATAELKSSASDLRWAIIIYDKNRSEIGAIYFNENGKSGAINDNYVNFGGNLYKWLNKNFADVVK